MAFSIQRRHTRRDVLGLTRHHPWPRFASLLLPCLHECLVRRLKILQMLLFNDSCEQCIPIRLGILPPFFPALILTPLPSPS